MDYLGHLRIDQLHNFLTTFVDPLSLVIGLQATIEGRGEYKGIVRHDILHQIQYSLKAANLIQGTKADVLDTDLISIFHCIDDLLFGKLEIP